MPKKKVDYVECLAETVEAFADGRVLLAAQGKEGPPNAMTIGWGVIGIIWGKPLFVVLVRPSRYTYGLIEEAGDFTVNVLPDELSDLGAYFGSVSGRDEDKFEEKSVTALPSDKVTAPIIGECVIHYECQVVHHNDVLPPELEESIKKQFYPSGDFHRIYFGEILACQREA